MPRFAALVRTAHAGSPFEAASPQHDRRRNRQEKEAASALPFTRRLCRCGPSQSLGRCQCSLSVPDALGHFARQSAGPCESCEREVETRFLEFLVSKPAIKSLTGHVAHLVVQDGPADTSPLETERDEVDRHLCDLIVGHPILPRCDVAHHPHPPTNGQGFSSTSLSTGSSTGSEHVIHTPSTLMSISSSCDPRSDAARGDARSRGRAPYRRTSHVPHRAPR